MRENTRYGGKETMETGSRFAEYFLFFIIITIHYRGVIFHPRYSEPSFFDLENVFRDSSSNWCPLTFGSGGRPEFYRNLMNIARQRSEKCFAKRSGEMNL